MSYQAVEAMRANEEKLRQWSKNYDYAPHDATVFEGGITGITYHRYRDVFHHIDEGMQLMVKPDPTNEFDKNATGIWYTLSGQPKQVGWIPKALNRVAAQAWGAGFVLEATVLRHRPEHGDNNQKLIIRVRVVKHSKTIEQELTEWKSDVRQIVKDTDDLISDGLVGIFRDRFRPEDERLGKLANAMAVSAYQEVLQHFDIEQMIDDMLSNSTIKRALKTFDEVETTPASKAKK